LPALPAQTAAFIKQLPGSAESGPVQTSPDLQAEISVHTPPLHISRRPGPSDTQR
jgi:hypothetical protein